MGGQQQVLHGREDRGVHGLREGQTGVAADHDQHRSAGDAADGALVDLAEEGGGEALLLERPGAALPQARPSARRCAARTAASRTTTKTKGWLFSALGAWVAAVRIRADGLVVDVVGQERPGRPLGVDHVEEVGHGTGRSRVRHGEPMVPSRWTAAPSGRIGRRRGDPLPLAPHRPGPVPAMTSGRDRRRRGTGGRGWQTAPHRRKRCSRASSGSRPASPRSWSSGDRCSTSPTPCSARARSTTAPRRPGRPDSTTSRRHRLGPSPWSSRASSTSYSRPTRRRGNPLGNGHRAR